MAINQSMEAISAPLVETQGEVSMLGTLFTTEFSVTPRIMEDAGAEITERLEEIGKKIPRAKDKMTERRDSRLDLNGEQHWDVPQLPVIELEVHHEFGKPVERGSHSLTRGHASWKQRQTLSGIWEESLRHLLEGERTNGRRRIPLCWRR
jgi:hypothetical protein